MLLSLEPAVLLRERLEKECVNEDASASVAVLLSLGCMPLLLFCCMNFRFKSSASVLGGISIDTGSACGVERRAC
jgi:hypothetical protein